MWRQPASSVRLSSRYRLAARGRAPKQDARADDEAEVVPGAVVVHLVDAYVRSEEGNEERDRRDDAVPEAKPETGHRSALRGHVLQLVSPRRARAQRQSRHDQQGGQDQTSLVHFVLLASQNRPIEQDYSVGDLLVL